jgi:hypothetical protein
VIESLDGYNSLHQFVKVTDPSVTAVIIGERNKMHAAALVNWSNNSFWSWSLWTVG